VLVFSLKLHDNRDGVVLSARILERKGPVKMPDPTSA
jgi:hypothetical protein